VRVALLVVAVLLFGVGAFAALSSPTPEGYDPEIHGADVICSSAILDVLGIAPSADTNSAAGGGPSIGIDDCQGPARRQVAFAVVAIVAGGAVLLLRRRLGLQRDDAAGALRVT
jgi:hypothetical protein